MLCMAIPINSFGRLRLGFVLSVVVVATASATHGQLASDELVTRTFRLGMMTNSTVRSGTVRTQNGTFQFVVSAQIQPRKEQLALMFADAGIALMGDPSTWGSETEKGYFYDEKSGALVVRATIADIKKIEPALQPMLASQMMGREARLRLQQTSPRPFQTPPLLPQDTQPNADPTPLNKGRLPFPPMVAPEGFRSRVLR